MFFRSLVLFPLFFTAIETHLTISARDHFENSSAGYAHGFCFFLFFFLSLCQHLPPVLRQNYGQSILFLLSDVQTQSRRRTDRWKEPRELLATITAPHSPTNSYEGMKSM